MNFYTYSIRTQAEEFRNITPQVREAVTKSGVKEGICVVFCPHTTAGITINENADPDVQHDLALGLAHAYPKLPGFQHFEGNSTAHLKSTTAGASMTVIVHDGHLVLGRWQHVYFCEFDGPRARTFYVKVLEG